MKRMILIVISVVFMAAACTPVQDQTPSAAPEQPQEAAQSPDGSVSQEDPLAVSSAGIVDGVIDPAYGMHGETNERGVPVLSLPIEIKGGPGETVCYALYMDDPDASNWVHWMAANIAESSIPEDFSRHAGDAVQGRNDFGTTGYGGPTPPDGDHTYQIIIYALDAPLDLQDGFSKDDLDKALEGHVLEEAVLTGLYKK